MLDSIYHMTLKLIKNCILRENFKSLSSFMQRYNGCHYITFRYLLTTCGLWILLHGVISHVRSCDKSFFFFF